MAEVAASINGSDAPASSTKKEQMTEIAMALLAQGRRHILVADIPSAVAALAESTQILAEQFGEQADECAESYYQYGIALLEMARTDTDVLGDAVEGGEKENEDGSSEEDGEEDEEEEADQKEGEEAGEKKTVNGSGDTNGKEEHVNGKAEANGNGEAPSAAATEKSEDVEMKEDSAQSKKPSEPAKVEQNGDSGAKKEDDVEMKEDTVQSEKPSEPAKVEQNGDSEAKKEEEGTNGEASKAETNGDSSTEAKPTIKPKNAAKGKSLKAAGSSTAALTSPADETINGDGDDANEDEAEDDVTNLQLAWEVFELAKKIFQRKAETDPTAKPRLADSLLRLAEVAIESENYSSAIEDMQKCLEIQKATFPADSRSVAETYYQLGVAYTFTTEFQEAVKSFESAADVIKLRLENLKSPGEKKPSMEEPKNMFHTIEGEIEELESLLPDIRDKIADTIDLEKEAARKLTEQKNGVATTNGAGSSSHAVDEASSAPLPGAASESPSSDKPALDITHLIRKKRKPEDGPAEVEPSASKKVCAEPEVADIAS